jgi:Zn-dependent M28 family amino/carboxypeptidase
VADRGADADRVPQAPLAAATEARLAADVRDLCRWPHRAHGSEGHAGARRRLVERFEELGLQPYDGRSFELPYAHRRLPFVNVVGVAPGAGHGGPPVLIGAHYDTVVGTPGADDNAAALAITLEVARRLRERPAERSVAIAHFDAEEPPHFHAMSMGSSRFVAEQMGESVHAAFVLDLVGQSVTVPGFEDVVGVMGSESHPALARAVDARSSSFLPVVTLPNRILPDMSDHYAFRLANVPYLFLTCGQGPHYHRPTDTPDRLDHRKMARIADLLEALVRDAASLEMASAVEHDTSELDTRHLRSILGDRAAAVGLHGPRDFDRVVREVVRVIQAG